MKKNANSYLICNYVRFRTQIPDATILRAVCAEYEKTHPDGESKPFVGLQSVPTDTTPNEKLN